MTARPSRRGFGPDDDVLFGDPAMSVLMKAQTEIRWLLNLGYPMGSVTELVGSHHQLTGRQRVALQRATASDRQLEARKMKQLVDESMVDGPVLIDGFNLIILLEVALTGGLLILGLDGVLRDLAGLRGTYRILDATGLAIDRIGLALESLNVPAATFFLDQNVSNSGRLKQLLLTRATQWPCAVAVSLVPNADSCLQGKERVVSQDAFVLDACASWINLSRTIVTKTMPAARIVEIAAGTE